MMHFLMAAAAALQPAAGAEATTLNPPTAQAIEAMCSDAGTLGYAFGAKGVPRSSKLEMMLGGHELDARFAPFTRAETHATPWSGRLAFATYTVRHAEGAPTRPMLDALSAAFEGRGWRRNAELEDIGKVPMYLMPIAGERVYELPESGLIAGFGSALGEFTLTCGHKGLIRENADEAFGKLPPGTPRPEAPPPPPPTAYRAEDCDRAEVQEEMLRLTEGAASAPLAEVLQRATYAERLSQWKIWRLRSSGRVSEDAMMKMLLGSLDGAGGDPLAAFAMLEPLLETLATFGEQIEAKDRAGACRTSFKVNEVFRKIETTTAAQWKAMDAAVEREAKRVGVSLD